MNRTYLWIVGVGLLLLAVAVVAFFLWRSSSKEESVVEAPKIAPSVSLRTYEGREGNDAPEATTLDTSTGMHVAVTWATWCRQCEALLESLESVHEERGGTLPIYAINRAEPDAIARPYLEARFPDSPIRFRADDADGYFAGIEGYAMPELVLVAANGEILWHHRGPITDAQLREEIERYIER